MRGIAEGGTEGGRDGGREEEGRKKGEREGGRRAFCVRMRFESLHTYPYTVSVSASAHIESLLCVYTITIFAGCRMPHPHAASVPMES